jgi:TRAP-type uncharacterized transport system substrate-binding protein
MTPPRLERSYHLRFIGDWGGANFHRICSWLTEEFCKRAGPRSRVSISSVRAGGIEALHLVEDGEADLCLVTPAMLMPQALRGDGMFRDRPTPHLRALAVLPQNDRLVLAVDSSLGITSFEGLRAAKPPLRIATASDDGTNFIGHVARLFMAAHGLDEAVLHGWGARYVTDTNPRDSLARFPRGEANAVLQEAVMTPWWADLVESGRVTVLPAEPHALATLQREQGFGTNPLPAGYWAPLTEETPALDFADFLVLVRDDLPEPIAHLLTWCLAETREAIERQYRHLPPNRAPLSYPLVPERMARTSVPLHEGARRYYRDAGVLAD